MSFVPLDFVQFKLVTQAERDAEPAQQSLTAMNTDSGFLESYMFDRWAIHTLLAVKPVTGDSLVFDSSMAMFVATPASTPILHNLRVYEDSTGTVQVKRFYKSLVKTGAGTGTMKPVGAHTLAGAVNKNYRVEIDSAGTKDWTEATFRWSPDGGATWTASGVPIATGSVNNQQVIDYIALDNGISILFTEGSYINAVRWDFVVIAASNQYFVFYIDTTSDLVWAPKGIVVDVNGEFKLSDVAGVTTIQFGTVGGDTIISYDPGSEIKHYKISGDEYLTVTPTLAAWPLVMNHNYEAIYHQFKEMATPSDPAVNYARFYAKDVAGLTLPHWKQGSTERAFALEGASPTFDDLFVTDDLDVNGDVDFAGNLTFTGGGVIVNGVALGFIIATLGLDSDFFSISSSSTNDDPTWALRQGRVETTDATVTTINTIPIPASTVVRIEVDIYARQTAGIGTVGHGAAYKLYGTYRNIGGIVTTIGLAVTSPSSHEDNAAWAATASISGTNVNVTVAGEGGKTITWHSRVQTMKVGS